MASKHDDLTMMDDLNAESLLRSLQQRFEAKQIFTWAGPVLISLNPFCTIPGLFDIKPVKAKDDEMLPHIFSVAERAWRRLLKEPTSSQAFIVNGESGAGKTEACRQLMRFIAEASASARGGGGDAEAGLEQSMLQTSRVLEAFGNAKTIRNNNSSRFGKLTWLLFNESQALVASRIELSLLEKSRLIVQGAGERSFHVFYALCAASAAAGAKLPQLKPASEWTILNKGKCVSVEGVDEPTAFEELTGALRDAGFDDTDLGGLWTLLSGVLHLGELQFKGEGGYETATITDAAPLSAAAAAFACKAEDLKTALLQRTVAAGSRTMHTVHLSGTDVADARDALVKHVYQSLFSWLVVRMNQMGSGGAAAAATGSVSAWAGGKLGLLDIYGFENLQVNSLEQLCINYANELLQQQFNEITFAHELSLYAEENVDVSEVSYKDNALVIELIARKPTGIFPLLDEQGMLGERGSGEAFKANLYEKHLGKTLEFSRPRFGQELFNVRHFAAEISYDPTEFLSKNVDELHGDLAMFLMARVGGLLAKIGQEAKGEAKEEGQPSSRAPRRGSVEPIGGAGGGRGAVKGSSSVSSRFVAQMTRLMSELRHSSPLYVRCVKPNSAQAASTFEVPLVQGQLFALGVMETVRIRRAGYPVRLPFVSVWDTYKELAPKKVPPEATDRERAAAVLSVLPTGMWQLGRTRAFLRDSAPRELLSLVETLRAERATAIQARLRVIRAKREAEGKRDARDFAQRTAAATQVQALARGVAAKKERERLRRRNISAATAMQCAGRRLAAKKERWRRQRGADEHHAATLIQKIARGGQARRAWTKLITMTNLAQATSKAHIMKERFQLVLALRRKYKRFLRPSELVVLCAVVKRLDASWGVKGRHQLVLTSSARVLCLEQDLKCEAFEVSCTRGSAEVKGKEFTIVGDNGKRSRFVDVLGDASRWVAALRCAQRLQAETKQDVAVETLVKSDEYQPDQMLRHQGYVVKRSLLAGKSWNKRWIVLHGRTIYWYKGADSPKGQLQLTAGASIDEYNGEGSGGGDMAATLASLARPHALIVRTPELAAAGVPGLILDAQDKASFDGWMEALRSAIPGGGPRKKPELGKAMSEGTFSVLSAAPLQGWLIKRSMHTQKEKWQRRWCALHQCTLYWYSGNPGNKLLCTLKGQLALTAGTRVTRLGPRPFAFAIATPEMERAGVMLGLQAPDEPTAAKWMQALGKAAAAGASVKAVPVS